MVHLSHDKRLSFLILSILIGFVLLGMLYFGIRLEGFRPENMVRWAEPGPGLVFNRFGMAYTDSLSPAASHSDATEPVTVELAIRPEFGKYSYFQYLLQIHEDEERRQLVIGQWRSTLITRNSNDYANEGRTPKIYAGLDKNDKAPHLVTIVSNESGTRFFFDGVLKENNRYLRLYYPAKVEQSRLVIGNSLSGNHPWIGTILGLALYDNDLGDEVVLRHYHLWRSEMDFRAFRSDAPRLLYVFDEGKGNIVRNQAGHDADLLVPERLIVLQKKVLSLPSFEGILSRRMMADILVNTTGFIPLGFLLFAALSRIKGVSERTGLVVTVLFCFLFSLSLEIVQVWIPTRDSSMLDLILNTLGGYLGGMLSKWMHHLMDRIWDRHSS